jgi:hypothetical protein
MSWLHEFIDAINPAPPKPSGTATTIATGPDVENASATPEHPSTKAFAVIHLSDTLERPAVNSDPIKLPRLVAVITHPNHRRFPHAASAIRGNATLWLYPKVETTV